MLSDSLKKDYSDKLTAFEIFAEPELTQIISGLPVDATSSVLDLGCGTGLGTRLLTAVGGLTVGVDLSLAHARAATVQARAARIVVADASRCAFRGASFDLLWACNSLNHLAEPTDDLRSLSQYLRPGGWIALAQSHLVPEMFFAWDYHFDARIRSACHSSYRAKYGLGETDTADSTRLLGITKDAGFIDVEPKTYVIERHAPLGRGDLDYFLMVFEKYWGAQLEPYLTAEDWIQLQRLCDPDSPEFCLNREDFHHLQTITLVLGRKPLHQAPGAA